MFHETRKTKIRRILVPVLIWLLCGSAAELLGILIAGLKNGGGDFGQLLALAHEGGEVWMLLFRAAASAVIFVLLMKKDTEQIRIDIYVQRILKEHPEFFTDAPVKTGELVFPLLMGVGFSLTGNLVLQLLGLAESVGESGQSALMMFSVGLFTCLLAPVSEELLCRGLIYRRTRTYMLRGLSVLISAGIFAVLHLDGVRSLYAFFLGILLCSAYERSRSVWFCIVMHASANLTAFLLNLTGAGLTVTAHPAVFLPVGILLLAGGFLWVFQPAGLWKRNQL